ncbi:hypothetical protein ACWEF6_02600 [Amycolatopsis sp. NPDC004772]
MPFDLGDVVPLSVSIDVAGVPTDGTVTLTVTKPDGTVDTPTPVHGATGQYSCDYLAATPGRHVVRWVSSSPNAAYTDVFDVREAELGAIVSLKDMKTHLDIKGTSRDEELRGVIEAVTGMIEEHLGMAAVRSTRTEEHKIRAGLVLNWTPVQSLVSMALVDGTYTWNVADLHVSPAGVVTSPLGVAPYGHLTVTYVAGPSVVPARYREAAIYTVQHLWRSKRPEKGASSRGGSGLDSSMGYQQAGYALPNYAIECLGAGMPGLA